MEVSASCPYCGAPITLLVDEGGGTHQRYVEDCEVCCQPIEVAVTADDEPGTLDDGLPTRFRADLTRADD